VLFGDSIPLTSKEDWMDAFNHYKKNQDEAASLAKKAYSIAIDNHTWKARMNAFLANIKKSHEE
jgi:spore maturation protein CgeB